MPFLQYVYVFLWAALGVLCVFIGKKHGITGYMTAGLFGFMTIWFGLRAFAGLPMLEGALGVIYRIIMVLFLAAIIAVWYVQRKRRLSELSEVIPHAEDCHCEHCEEEHEEERAEK